MRDDRETSSRAVYGRLGSWPRQSFAGLFIFQDIGSFISSEGSSSRSSSLVLSSARRDGSCSGWSSLLLRWLRGRIDEHRVAHGGARCSTAIAQLLAEFDLERTPAETQDEFALGPTSSSRAEGSEASPSPTSPAEVVDAFYRVRFGHLELEPESLEEHGRPARRARNATEGALTSISLSIVAASMADRDCRPERPRLAWRCSTNERI